jgi:hypothetical protein
MSDEKNTNELVVKAGSVTVLRQVGAGKAYVDVAQGEPVGDIDNETRERLLASGAIGKTGDAAYVSAARPVAGEVEPDEIDKDIIPAGSTEQVLGWVGDDLARARVAAEMERAKGPKARAGLLKKLDEVRADLETEPPTVPESYQGDVQPAPAGGVASPPNEAAAAVGKTADEAPAGDAGKSVRK